MKTILIFIDWFTPAFKAGGPVQSIANFVNNFKKEYDISIVTSDRDLGDTTAYDNLSLCKWIQRENYRVIYLDPSHQNSSSYRSIFKEKDYDVVYFNSFFSVPFTLKPLLIAKKIRKKIVLAPRGMLGAGALQIKPLKKRLFVTLSKLLGLFDGIRWHATAENEKVEIINIFGSKADIRVAPNLPSARLTSNVLREKKTHEVSLFFVSRIAQKKNLLESLKWLSTFPEKVKVQFYIIGPVDETEYWSQCKAEIEKLPVHIKAEWLGSIPNQKLTPYLTQYHFLYLPTLHENYGHAIVESLQFGCPVIISDRTPWRNLEEKGVGWDLSLDNPEKFVEVIEYCAAMGQEEYNAMSQRAFEYAKQVTEDPAVLEANRRLFEDGNK
jgi:glycosyltransferase involved in cell wall biosynthesis